MKRSIFIGILILLFLPSVKAQNTGLKVIRVPGCSEVESNYYVVDYPNGVSYTRPAGGFLSIKDAAGNEIALWGPNQWVRVEK